MTAVLLGKVEPNTAEWDGLRSQGLGGSEIAAVVGLSPWVSPFALWHRKAGNIGPQSVSESMNWGHRLEPVVLDAFAERFPDLHIERNVGTHHHDQRPWQIANPDALADGDPLDAKTADSHDSWKWGPDGSDEVPPYYRCQLIHYGDVWSRYRGYLAVLIGGNDFRTYELTWTEDEAAWLRAQGEAFWQSILDGNEPPLDGADSTYEAVRQLHPDIDGTSIELPAEVWQRFDTAKQNLDAAKTEHAAAKVDLTAAMGDARYGEVGGERVCIRQSTKGGPPYVKPLPKKERDAA